MMVRLTLLPFVVPLTGNGRFGRGASTMVVGASLFVSRHALKPYMELVKTLEGARSLAL